MKLCSVQMKGMRVLMAVRMTQFVVGWKESRTGMT